MKSSFEDVVRDWHECFTILFHGIVVGSKEFQERYAANQDEFDAIENGVLGMHGWTKDEFDKEMAARIIASTFASGGLPN